MTSSDKYNSFQNESETDYSKSNNSIKSQPIIDPPNKRYPYCLVWSPIKIFSWFVPIIGHAGICNSEGIIYEFGPEHVKIEELPFGPPTKYVLLELTEKQKNNYDKELEKSIEKFNKINFHFIGSNCHNFPVDVLNNLQYKGKNNYNVVNLWWIFLTKSKYVSKYGLFKTYIGFVLIVIIIYIIKLRYFK